MTDPYASESRRKIKIKGSVENISSSGLFFNTFEYIPDTGSADILIDFDPNANSSKFWLKVTGKIIRTERSGVGIQFTSIDIMKLKQCIINKLNKRVKIRKFNS